MATMVPTSELSKGTILEMDGGLFAVLEYERFKAGKGNSEARVRVKMRDVKTGFTQEKVWRTDDRIPKAAVESDEFQFLYNDGDLYHFMDNGTFEEKVVQKKVIADAAPYLTGGLVVDMLVFQGNPISISLPTSVDLKIATTEPGYKGDTATSGTKKATMETGLTVDVPLFLNSGDTVKVDTRSGGYVSRIA